MERNTKFVVMMSDTQFPYTAEGSAIYETEEQAQQAMDDLGLEFDDGWCTFEVELATEQHEKELEENDDAYILETDLGKFGAYWTKSGQRFLFEE